MIISALERLKADVLNGSLRVTRVGFAVSRRVCFQPNSGAKADNVALRLRAKSGHLLPARED